MQVSLWERHSNSPNRPLKSACTRIERGSLIHWYQSPALHHSMITGETRRLHSLTPNGSLGSVASYRPPEHVNSSRDGARNSEVKTDGHTAQYCLPLARPIMFGPRNRNQQG